ncbi:MAG TPA: cysteine--tRNA ligase [Dehalococcoidia bacterium]|nr:cysteine--tRNA ligase [Dehalococcoidia bacterium]
MRDKLTAGPVGPAKRATAHGVGGRLPIATFNTLTRTIEEFVPLERGSATIYTCGPTVYRQAHIGNLRSYLMSDWLRRLLEAQGYSVVHVKNITDVGHMRQEMLEQGEDKVIAAALAEGKTPAQIAQFYTRVFLEDERKLNILPAHTFPRASQNIREMVAMTGRLVDAGYAYETAGNVYFDVTRFPEYGKLSRQRTEGLESGGRVEADPLKRDQRDFTLWKAAEAGRALKWQSPWGEGFPGWHIECSAMAAKYLGPEIDFHTGGVDNIFPHHEDEIAQSEAAFGKRHVRCWMHGQHLLVDGVKMAKSTGNVYTVDDIEARGFDPLAFRYLCATAHYRTRLNFTWASLRAAQIGLIRLRIALQEGVGKVTKRASAEGERLRSLFWEALASDLNLPRALGIAWMAARSDLPQAVKGELLMDFDRIMGLELMDAPRPFEASGELERILDERAAMRAVESWERADGIRQRILDDGFEVRDKRVGTHVFKLAPWARDNGSISASQDVASRLGEPGDLKYTVSIVAGQGCEELERCLESVRAHLDAGEGEVIVVDNGFRDACVAHIDEIAGDDERVRVFHADHFLGSAAGRNVSLRQARGRTVIFIDTSVAVTGDVFARLADMLADSTVGVAGRWGVTTNDLRTFEEARGTGDVHAVEGYLMAFRRDVLREAGFLDEKYRFYRHLDLDFSFAVRSLGYRAVIDADLPVIKHDHVDWSATPAQERDRLSKRNFYRFLQKWGERTDLIGARK